MMQEQFLTKFMEGKHHSRDGFLDEPGNPIEGKLFTPPLCLFGNMMLM